MSVKSTLPTPKTKGTVTSGHLAVFSGTSGAVLQDGGAVPTDTGITQLTGNVTAGPGSGSVAATIANSAVTYAKIQNVSGTDKVLGRSSSGAGVVEEIATTGSGDVARATSPTFVTPILGTPTSGNLSNCTALPVGSVTGLGSGVATFLATPSSANLATALTDETGTGANVFADTPTLIAPILGTPTSGNLSNCTALPVGSVTGLGTGVATFLATPTSANLRGALTDETGGGAAVFATGPTLSAPVMTSLVSGGATVTFPAATGTVPIILASSGTASGTTSSASEANLLAVTIPSGVMGTNGHLTIIVLWKFTGTAGIKTPVIRHSTSSGDTSAGTVLFNVATASNALSQRNFIDVWNANSASAQVAFVANLAGYGGSATTPATGAINTANPSYINLNALTASGSDTAQVVGYTVTIYPGV